MHIPAKTPAWHVLALLVGIVGLAVGVHALWIRRSPPPPVNEPCVTWRPATRQDMEVMTEMVRRAGGTVQWPGLKGEVCGSQGRWQGWERCGSMDVWNLTRGGNMGWQSPVKVMGRRASCVFGGEP